MLGCILDYRMTYERAWDNAQRFAEEILGDPDDLWDEIVAIPQHEWNDRWEECRFTGTQRSTATSLASAPI
jgi:hypothetical protein